MASNKKLKDNLSRVKAPSPLGKSIFVGLRLTDAVWQYAFLHRGWASQLVQQFGGTPLQVLHASSGWLNPYYQLLVAMALGSGLKQAIHMAFISEQELSSGLGFGIGFFNTVFNSTNILFSVWSLTSQSPSPNGSLRVQSTASVAIGVCAYTVGVLTELASELQRRRFKKDPANKGKPYGGGLFSLATNINYGAYTLWRAGFALATGGWAWGLFNFSFFFYDFVTRGVPVLDQYCTQRVCLFSPPPALAPHPLIHLLTIFSMENLGQISKHAFITACCRGYIRECKEEPGIKWIKLGCECPEV